MTVLDGSYPVMDAVVYLNIDGLRKCIEQGGDVNKSEDENDSPLSRAISKNHWEKAILLISNGVDVNKGNCLRMLINKSRHRFEGTKFELAQLMIDNGANINTTDEEGNTLLHFYIRLYERKANMKIISWLVENGISIDARNKGGLTALDYAIPWSEEWVACYLIEQGAEYREARNFMDLQSDNGAPVHAVPLFRAVSLDKKHIVQKMMKLGIDLNLRVDNRCVVDFVKRKEMYQFLDEYKDNFNDEVYHLFISQRLKYVL